MCVVESIDIGAEARARQHKGSAHACQRAMASTNRFEEFSVSLQFNGWNGGQSGSAAQREVLLQ